MFPSVVMYYTERGMASPIAFIGLVDEVRGRARLGAGQNPKIAIGLGLAGLNDAAKVREAFPGYALVRAAKDATTACLGAHADISSPRTSRLER